MPNNKDDLAYNKFTIPVLFNCSRQLLLIYFDVALADVLLFTDCP